MFSVSPGRCLFTKNSEGGCLQSHISLVMTGEEGGPYLLLVPAAFVYASGDGAFFWSEGCLPGEKVATTSRASKVRDEGTRLGFAILELCKGIPLDENYDWSTTASPAHVGSGVRLSSSHIETELYLSAVSCRVTIDDEVHDGLGALAFFRVGSDKREPIQSLLGAPCWVGRSILGIIVAVSPNDDVLWVRRYSSLLDGCSSVRPVSATDVIALNNRVADRRVSNFDLSRLYQDGTSGEERTRFLTLEDLRRHLKSHSDSIRSEMLSKITADAKKHKIVFFPSRSVLSVESNADDLGPSLKVSQWLPLLKLMDEVG